MSRVVWFIDKARRRWGFNVVIRWRSQRHKRTFLGVIASEKSSKRTKIIIIKLRGRLAPCLNLLAFPLDFRVHKKVFLFCQSLSAMHSSPLLPSLCASRWFKVRRECSGRFFAAAAAPHFSWYQADMHLNNFPYPTNLYSRSSPRHRPNHAFINLL